MSHRYDVIVVGARCAGAPTAMLVARKGHRVLLVDRAEFPSDTLSTHVIHPPGVAALRRWGLLDTVAATGCPPFTTYRFDFGPVTVTGTPRPAGTSSTAYAPRRSVLDEILVRAAATSGVEVREGFTVDEVVVEDGAVTGVRGHTATGREVTESARVVIGADGRNSLVARAVGAEKYAERPRLQYACYTYWSDLPTAALETYVRPLRGWGVAPTNDELTMVVMGWPYAEARAFRADLERGYLATFDLAPDFADRVAGATRQAPFAVGAVAGYLRRRFGPGWVLVGDAAYNKDPITAQGISDAFRDAETCAWALDCWLSGNCTYVDTLAAWHAMREEEVGPMYDFTNQLATLEPPPPEMQQLFGAMQGNQEAMDGFVSVVAGTVSPTSFFAADNIGRIMSSAAGPATASPDREVHPAPAS